MGKFADGVGVRDLEVDGLKQWIVIKEDRAFEDIVRGWHESNKDTWLRHTQTRHAVIQAGGYNGVYPRLFSQEFDVVYTFEPHPLSFYCLVRNCQVDNIIKINGFLGEEATMMSCSDFSTHNPGLHHASKLEGNIVPQFRIDDFAFEALNLIQLDVEGFELGVLKGGAKTIERFLPTISCERGDARILDFLKAFGYQEVDKTFEDVIYKA